MPKLIKLELSPEERQTLTELRDHHPKAYAREHAAALLKIAEGKRLSEVAQSGLLKARTNETIGLWLKNYQTKGIAGLLIKPGRGRKAAFSPSPAHSSRHQTDPFGNSAA